VYGVKKVAEMMFPESLTLGGASSGAARVMSAANSELASGDAEKTPFCCLIAAAADIVVVRRGKDEL
jgi:hypothetical protein